MQDEKMRRFDRIKGVLYGVAIGDCLGAPFEFMSAREIQWNFDTVTDIMRGGWLNVPAGVGTDDTAMTLAVAEGIMKTPCGIDPIENIGAEFIKWFYDAPIGAGAACARSINLASKRGKVKAPKRETWFKAAEKAHYDMNGRSGGNGSLMRTAPVALFRPINDPCSNLAFNVSKMTHYDEDAAFACVMYCGIIRLLIRGYEMTDAVERALRGSPEYRGAFYASGITDDYRPNPSGYVKDSFKTALWGIGETCDFETALIAVVNLGGDCDTTGAIVGGIAGAAYG